MTEPSRSGVTGRPLRGASAPRLPSTTASYPSTRPFSLTSRTIVPPARASTSPGRAEPSSSGPRLAPARSVSRSKREPEFRVSLMGAICIDAAVRRVRDVIGSDGGALYRLRRLWGADPRSGRGGVQPAALLVVLQRRGELVE